MCILKSSVEVERFIKIICQQLSFANEQNLLVLLIYSINGVSPIKVRDLNFVHIGKIIRENRVRQGLTQLALADALDTVSSYISRVERGKGISLPLLVSLSEMLNFSLDEIVPDRQANRESEMKRVTARYSSKEIELFIGAGKGAVDAYRKLQTK